MTYIEDPIWYAPKNVIHHFQILEAKLSDKQKATKSFDKVEEMFAVAVMLTGIQKLQGKKYWLQMVPDSQECPDVRSFTYVDETRKSSNHIQIQHVEVVTYWGNDNETPVDLLKRTKLSAKRPYDHDSQLVILCRLRRANRLPPFRQICQELAERQSRLPVFLLGKTREEEPAYKIAQVNPAVDLVTEFDLGIDTKAQHAGVMRLVRGTKPLMKYLPDEKYTPFEKLFPS